MDAAEATAVYGRAGVAGAVGGGLLGPLMVPAVLPWSASVGVSGALRAMLFLSPWAVVAGVIDRRGGGWGQWAGALPPRDGAAA